MAQAVGGDGLSRTDHLLYAILDQLRMLTWLQSADGAKGRNRPKPISPSAQPKRVGRTDRDPAEVMAMLARYGPQREGSADVHD